MKGIGKGLLALAIAGVAPGMTFAQEMADAIYHEGDILTMAGDQPAYVEVLVVKDGKILAFGDRADI